MISNILQVKHQTEAIIIITVAVLALSLDDSFAKLAENLQELQQFNFGEEIQKSRAEPVLRSVLAIVMVTKAITSRVFLVLYVVLLWPVVFEKRRHLMTPWLVLGFVRSLVLSLVTLLTGTYVCLVHKGYHLICVDFVLAQAIDNAPTIYAWFSMKSYYHKLCAKQRQASDSFTKNQTEDGGNFITESTINTLVHDLRPIETKSRSLDSLLTLASTKVSQNHVSGGFADYVKETLSLTDEDVARAKQEKSCRCLFHSKSDLELAKKMSFSNRRQFEPEKELNCVSFEGWVHDENAQGVDNGNNPLYQEGKVEIVSNVREMAKEHFGCQVNTLSRKIFKQSPVEVTKRFSLVKK